MTTKAEPAVGPELDEAIAEKVMGWQRWDTFADQARKMPEVRFFRPDRQHPTSAPRYSTDIAAAWPIVAYFTAVKSHGCTHHFEMAYFAGEAEWRVEIGGRECGRPLHPVEGRAETLPEAICRAALKALQ